MADVRETDVAQSGSGTKPRGHAVWLSVIGVPRTVRNKAGSLVHVDDTIFSTWAQKMFPGRVRLLKLDSANCLGNIFLKYGSEAKDLVDVGGKMVPFFSESVQLSLSSEVDRFVNKFHRLHYHHCYILLSHTLPFVLVLVLS